MAKAFKCPNCGSTSRENLSDTEFKCIHCETIFYDTSKDEIKRAVAEELKKSKKGHHDAMAASYQHATKMRRTILIMVITFMLAGLGFTFYMVRTTTMRVQEESDKMHQELRDRIHNETHR